MVQNALMRHGPAFPFSAILGLEEVKTALLCMMVSPNLHSILIVGPPGVGKSVATRSMGDATWSRPIVNLPAVCAQDQVFGGLDLEQSLANGRICFYPGVLLRADRKIIYTDDVNLMEKGILLGLLEAATNGENVVEREGLSHRYACDFQFAGSMNSSEQALDPHLLDRFDICSVVEGVKDEERLEVTRRRMQFEQDPVSFCSYYEAQETELACKVRGALERIKFVSISEELLEIIADVCDRLGVQGHRGDIAMANVSRALAALDARDEVRRQDLQMAAALCLRHRQPSATESRRSQAKDRERGDAQCEGGAPFDRKTDSDRSDMGAPTPPNPPTDGGARPDVVFPAGDAFEIIDFLRSWTSGHLQPLGRPGRRDRALSREYIGRYARSRIADERPRDIALDASIRAAAPYQRGRERRGLAIALEPRDLRQKVRESGRGTTILFLVDASGSIGARSRMVMVKGAILSMLRDSYLKRDRVGLMAFRRDKVELLLPPTRSVSLAYKKMKELPTGGRTPLSMALLRAHRLMTAQTRLLQGERCYVVLVTDGRANMPLQGEGAMAEALAMAREIRSPASYKWTVVDAGPGYPRLDNAIRLAEALDATYFRLSDLNAERLAERVRVAMA